MPRKYKKVEREHKPRTRVKEDERARAIALIDAGLNTSQIEEQTGVSRSQIRRYKRNLRMWNNPSAPRFKPAGRPPKTGSVRDQRDLDDSVVQALQTDLTPLTTVSPIIHSLGQREANQPSRISELATIIATSTATIDHYLRSNGFPWPSFHPDAPRQLIPSNDVNIEQAQNAVLEATTELQDLLTGPTNLCRPSFSGSSLHAIQRFGIAQKVPIGGQVSFVHLAKACNISEPDVRRMLRHAMVHHRMFCEPLVGYVAHTAASRAFAEDEKIQHETEIMFDDVYPANLRAVEALQTFNGDEPTQSAFSLSHGTDLAIQPYLQKYPDKEQKFSSAMKSLVSDTPTTSNIAMATGMHPFAHDMLISMFPWPMVQEGATVVDISTTPSAGCMSIAEVYSHISLVVQGTANAIREMQVPPQLSERVTLMAHDAFAEQPIVGADIYLFRGVFRCWPDKYCVRMLQKLIPAMRAGSRIIINDVIMPEPKTMPVLAERRVRNADLTMTALFNSKERERNDWIRLLERAEKRLHVDNVQAPPVGQGMGIIVASLAE